MEEKEVLSWESLVNEVKLSDDAGYEVNRLIEKKEFILQEYKKELEKLSTDVRVLQTELKEQEENYLKDSNLYIEKKKDYEDRAVAKKVRIELKNNYALRIMKAESVPSSTDQRYLELLEKKAVAYKKLTGITWDYFSRKENVIEGYIRHSKCNEKVKYFSVKTEGKAQEEIASELWKHLEKFNRK